MSENIRVYRYQRDERRETEIEEADIEVVLEDERNVEVEIVLEFGELCKQCGTHHSEGLDQIERNVECMIRQIRRA